MKKKKFLVSAALATLMLTSSIVTTTAFAETETKQTELTFTVEETYEWSIHPAISFGENAGAGKAITRSGNTVSVTKSVLADDHKLNITIKGFGPTYNGSTRGYYFTISDGKKQNLDYKVISASSNDYVDVGQTILTVNPGEGSKSEDLTFILSTRSGTEVAGSYSGKVIYEAALKSIYLGYYADIDGNGTVDGVIFADLISDDTVMFNYGNTFSYSAASNLKEYYVSQESFTGVFGTAPVISPVNGTTGNDRFYVMALNDIDSSMHYWYNSAYSTKITDYNTITSQNFGSGKQNTANMIYAWNNSTYGDQDANDMWGLIQTQVDNGWFIPSFYECAVFNGNLNITRYNCKKYNLRFWTSSVYKEDGVFVYYNGGFGVFPSMTFLFVRLATTF